MIASESFQAGKLLIIGDLIIDETYRVKASKLSPEAPVPVVMQTTSIPTRTLGGAGLAASYAVKHNIPSIFVSACSDNTSKWIRNKFDMICLSVEEDITKTRYIDKDSNYHLLRVDNDRIASYKPFNSEPSKKVFLSLLIKTILKNDIRMVVMLDYCKGLLTDSKLNQMIIEECHKRDIKVYVDTRSKDIKAFRNADFIKLNDKELLEAYKTLNVSSVHRLIDELSCDTLIITRGKDGAELHAKDKDIGSINFVPDLSGYSGVPDVTGCGDVFDVTFCNDWCINNNHISALINAVKSATKFAYKPIEERLQC